MSIVPRLLDSVFRDPFGEFLSVVTYPEDVLNREIRDAYNTLNRLQRVADTRLNRELSSVRDARDRFEVNLDCSHFKPEEINVKLVDNDLVIDAKHEERSDDHGFISRQFTRRYVLPENVEIEKLESKLGMDGVLKIEAPKRVQHQLEGNERKIPITLTNKVYSNDQPSVQQGSVTPQQNQEQAKNKK